MDVDYLVQMRRVHNQKGCDPAKSGDREFVPRNAWQILLMGILGRIHTDGKSQVPAQPRDPHGEVAESFVGEVWMMSLLEKGGGVEWKTQRY